MIGSLVGLVFAGLLVVSVGGAIGFGIAMGKYAKALESYKESHSIAQELLTSLESISARMNMDVSQHSARVEQIDRNLIAAPSGSGDAEHIRQAASDLMAADEQLQTELAGAKLRLDEQSQKLSKRQADARTDALTMLLNRRSFDESLQSVVRNIAAGFESGALLMIDIDHFKLFNDRNGHQVGDKVLQHVARTLRGTLLGSDAVVARYGGEEFAVVLPATNETREKRLAVAKELASKIRAAVEQATLMHEGEALSVQISIGLVAATANITFEQIVARADEALYAAKNAGRNRCYYHTGKTCLPVEGGDGTIASVPSQSIQPRQPKPAFQGGRIESPQGSVQQDDMGLQPARKTEATPDKLSAPALPQSAQPVAAGKPGRDRRKYERARCSGIHFVAPCTDERIPSMDKFFRVQFFDISSSGFAMILPAAPTTESFVVALKKPTGLVFVGARVMNVRPSNDVKVNGQPMLIVGCKFTQRHTPPCDSPIHGHAVSV